ncbi:hypothetical protein GC175_21345 [bacterium]|nr:hypothetical protein [bacterium]
MNFLRRLDPILILLLALTVLALAPLLGNGYFFSAHDGRHSVFFVTMFDEAIRDGALWPRWAMHHSQGYGYPTFVIQAPFAFYVAEIFILLGAGITNAVKLTWGVSTVAAAWGMYVLVRTWTEAIPRNLQSAIRNPQLAALLAALLYVFIPYRLLDMYVRAALAETMLLAWFPWAFWAFDRLIVGGLRPDWQGRLLVAALTLGALLMTHVIALITFTPLLMLFVLFRLWHVQRIDAAAGPSWWTRTVLAAAAGIAGLLLALVFIAPLLAEGPLLNQETFVEETYQYERHFVYWGQFFSSFWGYGYSDDPNGANDGLGFQVGLLPWILMLVGVVLFWRSKDGGVTEDEERLVRPLAIFLLVATLGILAVMTPIAAPLWQVTPQLSVIQFPWRLLGLAAFTVSAVGGLIIGRLLTHIEAEEAMGGVLVAGVLVGLASFSYARPAALQPIEPWREDGRAVFEFETQHPDMYGYTRLVEETFDVSPMTPQYQDPDFSNNKIERLAILSGAGNVLSHYSRGHSFGGEVQLSTPAVVQVRVYEHPGWQARIDGQPVPHRVSPPYGLIELDVPAGPHSIDVRMGSTPIHTVSAVISVATLFVLLALWAGSKRKNKAAQDL